MEENYYKQTRIPVPCIESITKNDNKLTRERANKIIVFFNIYIYLFLSFPPHQENKQNMLDFFTLFVFYLVYQHSSDLFLSDDQCFSGTFQGNRRFSGTFLDDQTTSSSIFRVYQRCCCWCCCCYYHLTGFLVSRVCLYCAAAFLSCLCSSWMGHQKHLYFSWKVQTDLCFF